MGNNLPFASSSLSEESNGCFFSKFSASITFKEIQVLTESGKTESNNVTGISITAKSESEES